MADIRPAVEDNIVAMASEQPGEVMEVADVTPPRGKRRTALILTALYFIAALDQTIVTTALPTISSKLHSTSGYIWVGAAYSLASAACGPIWAKCSDIWGRKPALLASVGLFAAASAIAGTSTGMAMLIAARVLQGAAGAGLLQLTFITISDMYSMRQRTLYLGYTGLLWAVAAGVGPLIGGALTQLASWKWCFLVNLPVCGIAWFLLFAFLNVQHSKTGFREGVVAIDWAGTFSVLGVTLMLLLGLDFGGSIFPWSSPKVICLLVFGTLMIGIFIYSEQRLARYPLMLLGIFRGRSNIASLIAGLANATMFIVVEYYLPLYFQSAKQASPLRSGLLLLPCVVSCAAADIATGIYMHRTGRYRDVIWLGFIVLTAGAGSFVSFDADTSIGMLIGLQILCGAGAGALFSAPTISIQNTINQADTAAATGTSAFLKNVATSISIVVGGVVFQNSMTSQASKLRSAGLSDAMIQRLSGVEAAANVGIVQTIANVAQQNAIRTAYADSFRIVWIMCTAIAGVGLIATCFVHQKPLRKEHTETKTGLQNMQERARQGETPDAAASVTT